jgi:hypothetical protein
MSFIAAPILYSMFADFKIRILIRIRVLNKFREKLGSVTKWLGR